MRSTLGLLASLALFVALASVMTLWAKTRSESGTAESEGAVRSILQAQEEAWNRGDVAAFMEGYWRSPELTFAGSQGITRGWEAVLARYKATYADRAAMGQLTFSGLEFRPLGPDAALLLGHWRLQRKSGDVDGVFSLVWQRLPEGWRIVHDHTSAVVEPKS